MAPPILERGWARLGACFEYPTPALRSTLWEEACGDAEGPLRDFARAVTVLTDREWQELYGRTFDVTPLCTPYLSVHLFGEESFKRGALMAGLKEAYGRVGYEAGGELPDHLAVVLKALPSLPPEEGAELERFVLARALGVMEPILRKSSNPYADALKAVQDGLASPEVFP